MNWLRSCVLMTLCGVGIIWVTGCGSSVPIGERVGVIHTESLRQGLMRADRLLVYEGLPHQAKENELLQQELAKGGTESILGYPFYVPPHAAKAPEGLKRLLSDAANYREYSGPKTCGGFHPDYALSWQNQGTRHDLLVCYGCSEVLWGDGARTWAYDLKHDALAKLQKLLEPHASRRPRSGS